MLTSKKAGGPGVKNPPADAGDTGSTPGPGRPTCRGAPEPTCPRARAGNQSRAQQGRCRAAKNKSVRVFLKHRTENKEANEPGQSPTTPSSLQQVSPLKDIKTCLNLKKKLHTQRK